MTIGILILLDLKLCLARVNIKTEGIIPRFFISGSCTNSAACISTTCSHSCVGQCSSVGCSNVCQNCQTVCNFDPSGAFCGVSNQCHAECGVQCWSVGYETFGGGSYGPGGCSGKRKK